MCKNVINFHPECKTILIRLAFFELRIGKKSCKTILSYHGYYITLLINLQAKNIPNFIRCENKRI